MESDFSLWILFFLYSSFVAIIVQFIILPSLLPNLHWGNGLLKNTDAITYHQIAHDLAGIINKRGWQYWILSPLGQTPAGIAGAFYAVSVPKPWVLIPLHSALHSGAALILFKLLSFFGNESDRRITTFSVLPFLAFPSAASWYTQLNKDSFFIFGNLLFIYVWCQWVQKRNIDNPLSLKQDGYHFFLWALAYILVWIIRPYWGPIFFFLSVLIFFMLFLNQIYFISKDRGLWKNRGGYLVLSLIVVVAFGTAIQKKNLPHNMVSKTTTYNQLKVKLDWSPSNYLPTNLDSQLKSLAIDRKAFILKYTEAGTNVDTHIIFHNVIDMIAYLPRAFYVGLFMPTFSITFRKGVNPGASLMRWVTGFEMIFLYLTYPFFLLAIWLWKNRLELWVILLWGISGIILYTLVSPNIGALYRFRYGFLMTLASLGILRAGILIKHLKAKHI